MEPYRDRRLFPFFEGLLAEGALRTLQARQARLAEEDRFGLLLATCREDAPGAVTVHPSVETEA
jgi:serine/threonine-protein kinase HipA